MTLAMDPGGTRAGIAMTRARVPFSGDAMALGLKNPTRARRARRDERSGRRAGRDVSNIISLSYRIKRLIEGEMWTTIVRSVERSSRVSRRELLHRGGETGGLEFRAEVHLALGRVDLERLTHGVSDLGETISEHVFELSALDPAQARLRAASRALDDWSQSKGGMILRHGGLGPSIRVRFRGFRRSNAHGGLSTRPARWGSSVSHGIERRGGERRERIVVHVATLTLATTLGRPRRTASTARFRRKFPIVIIRRPRPPGSTSRRQEGFGVAGIVRSPSRSSRRPRASHGGQHFLRRPHVIRRHQITFHRFRIRRRRRLLTFYTFHLNLDSVPSRRRRRVAQHGLSVASSRFTGVVSPRIAGGAVAGNPVNTCGGTGASVAALTGTVMS